MFKIARGLLIVGAAVKGVSMVLDHYEEKKLKNDINNFKFSNELSPLSRESVIENDIDDINEIYNKIRPLFTTTLTTNRFDAEYIKKIKKSNRVVFDIQSEGYTEVKLNTSKKDPAITDNKGFFKLVAYNDGKNTQFIVRLILDRWDGYIDLKLFEAEGYKFNDKNIFIVKNKGLKGSKNISGLPDIGDVYYFETAYIKNELHWFKNEESNFEIQVRELEED